MAVFINCKRRYLSYVFVFIFLIYVTVRGSVNLAFQKEAHQSSTLNENWSADNAVDGNRNEHLYNNSCGHTDRGRMDAWWQVDLDVSAAIDNILIFYRIGYSERFLGFHLYVSNESEWTNGTLCYHHEGPELPETFQNISCSTTGRYVTLYNYRNQTHVDWGYGSEAYLELCEVEVYGCSVGLYGVNCSFNCSSNCIEGVCDPSNGRCRYGCLIGWTGQMCDQSCPLGFYGLNCIHNCSNCVEDICEPLNGECVYDCRAGWTGTKCNQECVPGTFGFNCSNECGNCIDGQFCDHVTGYCHGGCTSGWIYPDCKECIFGKYGNECNQTCGHCYGNSSCDSETGVCTAGCLTGYTGLRCEEKCVPGTFGSNCSNECGNCIDGQFCDHVTGYCHGGCKSGWSYPYCKECISGKYGNECNQTCGHCHGNSSCDSETGVCTAGCLSGYTGPRCKQKCTPGTFGFNCSNECGKCIHDQTCHHATGKCDNGCKSGWSYPFCKSCEWGKYGIECNQICGYCYGNSSCDSDTGVCLDGCLIGYTGSICKEKCIGSTFGLNCSNKCGSCEDDEKCDHITGHCIGGCKTGWKSPYCLECEWGKYGNGCSQLCGHCHGNATCDQVTGVCTTGCLYGYTGPLCKQKLETRIIDKCTEYLTPLISVTTTLVFLLVILLLTTFMVLIRKKCKDVCCVRNESPIQNTDDVYAEVDELNRCNEQEISNNNTIAIEKRKTLVDSIIVEPSSTERKSEESKISFTKDFFDTYEKTCVDGYLNANFRSKRAKDSTKDSTNQFDKRIKKATETSISVKPQMSTLVSEGVQPRIAEYGEDYIEMVNKSAETITSLKGERSTLLVSEGTYQNAENDENYTEMIHPEQKPDLDMYVPPLQQPIELTHPTAKYSDAYIEMTDKPAITSTLIKPEKSILSDEKLSATESGEDYIEMKDRCTEIGKPLNSERSTLLVFNVTHPTAENVEDYTEMAQPEQKIDLDIYVSPLQQSFNQGEYVNSIRAIYENH